MASSETPSIRLPDKREHIKTIEDIFIGFQWNRNPHQINPFWRFSTKYRLLKQLLQNWRVAVPYNKLCFFFVILTEEHCGQTFSMMEDVCICVKRNEANLFYKNSLLGVYYYITLIQNVDFFPLGETIYSTHVLLGDLQLYNSSLGRPYFLKNYSFLAFVYHYIIYFV